MAQPRHGRRAAAGFFDDLRVLRIEHFEPVAMLTNDHRVGVMVEIEVTVPATGRTIRDSEFHLWTFDDAGMVVSFRHILDTHKHVTAYRAELGERV
jgi:hypothetical protein